MAPPHQPLRTRAEVGRKREAPYGYTLLGSDYPESPRYCLPLPVRAVWPHGHRTRGAEAVSGLHVAKVA